MSIDIAIKRDTDVEAIKHRIYEVQGMRVMLDRDLAELYGVETRVLNQSVRRNIDRFPEDFMFQLSRKDFFSIIPQYIVVNKDNTNLKSQIVTSSSESADTEDNLKSQNVISSWGGTRKMPYAFTELGIAMLSSVLRSETAIQVNINIMRAFVAIRHAIAAWQGVNLKVEQLSHKVDNLNARVDEILHEQCRRLRTPLNKRHGSEQREQYGDGRADKRPLLWLPSLMRQRRPRSTARETINATETYWF